MCALAANRIGVSHSLQHVTPLSFAGILGLHYKTPVIHGLLTVMCVTTATSPTSKWQGIWMLSREGKNLVELMFIIAAVTYFAGQNVLVPGRYVVLQQCLINGLMR